MEGKINPMKVWKGPASPATQTKSIQLSGRESAFKKRKFYLWLLDAFLKHTRMKKIYFKGKTVQQPTNAYCVLSVKKSVKRSFWVIYKHSFGEAVR